MANSTSPPAKTPSSESQRHRVRLMLAIDETPYSVRPLRRGELPPEGVRGFVLTRSDRRLGKVRHAIVETLDGPSCSCEDNRYRQHPNGGRCKHVLAALACGLF